MSRGLNWTTIQLSLAGGLETKSDKRASDARQLDIARDIKYAENGGAQTRFPFDTFSNAIFGGGTLANCRRIDVVNDELVVFTDDELYTWNAQQQKWLLRGTHLAVAVDETPRFVTPGDQIEGDRAELAGTVVFAWTEATTVYATAYDKATGAVLVPPTAVASAVGRPRVVALATVILLFADSGGGVLSVRQIDPADPATGFAGPGVGFTNFNQNYDVVRAGTQDFAIFAYRRTVTTSYSVATFGPAVFLSAIKARTCDGPIAVAATSDGTQAQIVRANGTNIQGDLLTTSTLADVFTGQAIGTADPTINQVTVAYANATTAHAFWTSSSETSGFSEFTVKTNSVTTANVVGAQSTLRLQLGIASRAFGYDGHVYVWLAFASESGTSVTGNASGVRAQLQNTYFLYREDRHLVSRCLHNVGGGFSSSSGHLPGVALTSGSKEFSWCGTSRRIIEIGGDARHTGFGARALRDVTFSFDSDDARRCARIGKTLYITGGIPMQYDGVQIAEVGFLVYPWFFEPQNGGPGNLAAGTYTWKATMRWPNAQGEIDRSTTATGMTLTIPASRFVFLNYFHLNVTKKLAPRPPTQDMWRTEVNPPVDAPFYLVTSQDPNAGIVNNGYVDNIDTNGLDTPLPDNFADATLRTKELNPENGAVLEYLAPPAAQIIFATDTRVFLGDVAGDPDRVWYSRLRASNEVASFHDALTIDVPPTGGRITAIQVINETLVVFRESAIYSIPGQGFDNASGGQNYGPPTQISSDVGAVSAEAVALTPLGLLCKSRKGWYLVTLGGVRYVGAAVAAFDAETVRAVHVMDSVHEVRILTSGRLLTWDYQAISEVAPMGVWAESTIEGGLHATMWNGSYVYLTATGPRIERSDYTGVNYGMDVESGWIPMQGLQGAGRVRALEILGEWRSAFVGRIRVARDYQYAANGEPAYYDDVPWVPDTAIVGNALQVRHMPSQGACEAIKVRFTAVAAGATATLDTATDLSDPIATSGADWTATFNAVPIGEYGNAVTMSIALKAGVAGVDVREHFAFDTTLNRWREDLNNIGVLITGVVTVGQLEAAIVAGTSLATLPTPDVAPAKTINGAIGPLVETGAFSGGAFGAPTGEACKLTGLSLEVGVKPGLHRRLSADQKV